MTPNTGNRSELALLGAAPQMAEQIRSGLADLCTVSAEREPQRGLQRVLEAPPDIVVLALDGAPEAALRVAETLAARAPDLPVLAVASRKDPDLILRTMKARVRDFVMVTKGLDELRLAVQQVLERVDAPKPEQAGNVVAVWPGRGGAGASFLAVNLAGGLARRGKRVIVVDLELRLGDVLALLDVASKTPLSKVLENLSRLDRELLESLVPRHASGIHVLAESDQRDGARELEPADAERLIAFLRSHYDVVVLDGLNALSPTTLAALSASAPIFLVLTQDVPALKNANVRLQSYHRAGLDVTQIRVVVNRFTPSAEVGAELITRTLELPVAATVAYDPKLVAHAVNHATLMADLAPKAKVTADLDRLAEMALGAAPGAAAEASGGGLLSKLFGK